jgi:polar amino acid transport system substrate-binding protein
MKKINQFLLLLLVYFMTEFLYASDNPAAKKISICSDDNFWYPFSYMEKNQAKGWHIDIITTALKNLGYQAKVIPIPWKRCLEYGGKYGQFDAIANASYKKSRAEFLVYPPEFPRKKKSDWRIMQVEYVVVSSKSDNYHYHGDPHSLPFPIRATTGYSIVDDLKQMGIRVDVARNAEQNIKRLVRDKKGVVITVPQSAKFIAKKHQLMDKILIHDVPIKSKSYFFAFSKKSKITEEEKYKIWREIIKIREDKTLMNQFNSKY